MRTKEHHGMAGTPVYLIWKTMIKRCHNPNDQNFRHYGGRGIHVCEAWRKSFIQFYNDVGPRPDGLTLERLDNSKGYEPGNAAWRSRHDQTRNKRNNIFYFHRGENLILRDIFRIYGTAKVNLTTVRRRVFVMGWSVAEAISKPPARA